jgi:hypothetical protein
MGRTFRSCLSASFINPKSYQIPCSESLPGSRRSRYLRINGFDLTEGNTPTVPISLESYLKFPVHAMCLILPGGTGTGGYVVSIYLTLQHSEFMSGRSESSSVMLFRLGMSIDETIMAYTRLSEDVFSKRMALRSPKKTNASRLENAITKIIQSSLSVHESQAQTMRLLDAERPKW